MEDRLTQCLNEIMYSDTCPSDLRSIFQNILDLNEEISAMDASDFENYFNSNDFVEDMYSLFGVDIMAGEEDI